MDISSTLFRTLAFQVNVYNLPTGDYARIREAVEAAALASPQRTAALSGE